MKFDWNKEYLETALQFFREGNEQSKYLLSVDLVKGGDGAQDRREVKVFNYLKGTKLKVLLFKATLAPVYNNFGSLLFFLSQNFVREKNQELSGLSERLRERERRVEALEAELAGLREAGQERKCSSLNTVVEEQPKKRPAPKKLKVRGLASPPVASIDDKMGIEQVFKELKKIKRNNTN